MLLQVILAVIPIAWLIVSMTAFKMSGFNACGIGLLITAVECLVVYGMGNGADKIIDELTARDISVSDFFASDGFVRDRTFRGYKVESYNNVCERFDDFIILLSFAVFKDDLYEKVLKS